MKTSLAIVFAAAALMLSATVATARFQSYSGKSPGVFTVQAPLPSTLPRPGHYRGNR